MKIVNKTTPDCAPISSTCVTWQGEDIPCLKIEKGDELNVVVAGIAKLLCEVAGPTNLADLSLTSLLQICNQTEPQVRTLQNVLQLMIDNNVCLKELIDIILGRLDALEQGNTFLVDLSCLSVTDSFGNQVQASEEQLFQILIRNICEMLTRLGIIETDLIDLRSQINAIDTNPDVSVCVSTTPLPLLDAVEAIADEVCEFQDQLDLIRADLGTNDEVSAAIGQLCNLDDHFIGNGNWTTVASGDVVNIALLVKNLTVLGCDLHARVTTIEDTCCALKCEDIKLGFVVVPGVTANSIVLMFRKIDGTFIPAGFVDCGVSGPSPNPAAGSKVTVTDVHNQSKEFPITLVQDLETEDLILQNAGLPLDLTEPINIKVTSKLCGGGLTCTDCLSMEFDFQAAGCPACLIVTDAGKDGGTVTIIYETP